MKNAQVFFHKLDSHGMEVVFAPFHDPELAPLIPCDVSFADGVNGELRPFWCWTSVCWKSDHAGKEIAILNCSVNKFLDAYTHLIICLYAPITTTMTISCDFGEGMVPLSKDVPGTNTRQELLIPFGNTTGKKHFLKTVELRLTTSRSGNDQINLIWFGLRKQEVFDKLHDSKLKRKPEDWRHLVKATEDWGKIEFAKNLLFSTNDLHKVRKKIKLPGWKEHFKILTDHAKACLSRNPEEDIGDTISADNKRYSRSFESDRVPYYWDSLTLAFVGLVREDSQLIEHALRYLCCMLDSPRWIETAECAIPTSTWNYRSFPAEMTTTSIVLLADWLDFALPDHTRSLLRQTIWDRGVSPVISDLLHYPYMSQMNQGAVFSRAVILGSLFLEKHWAIGKIADEYYSYMTAVLRRYIQSDGYCSEGPIYLCQTLQGVISAIIAYARHRKLDWRKSVSKYLSRAVHYLETLSSELPGRSIPVNDSRTLWLGGDGIPILANLDPASSLNRILHECLINGQVFRSSGTLTNSGGILGIVYGPAHVHPSESIRPRYKKLKKGKILSCCRKHAGKKIGFWTIGATQVVGHGHPDKGQFIIEVDSTPVLVDPGMVRYSAIDAGVLQSSCFHNVITPILENGRYPNQNTQAPGSRLRSKLVGNRLSASFDLTSMWPGFFYRYKREIFSESPNHYRIIDKGKCLNPHRIAFHVNIMFLPKTYDKSITVQTDKFDFSINADWCAGITSPSVYSGSYSDEIYHLAFESELVDNFSFETFISINI